MRTGFGMNVADLTSPDKAILRFIWSPDEDNVIVYVFGRDNRRSTFSVDTARQMWKNFRKTGWLPTDDEPFSTNGDFGPRNDESAESMEWSKEEMKWTRMAEAMNEIELEAEMEGAS